ncbi:AAA family ATPase [Alkalihalobacillus sp. AL-G]|uniref:AAA family ATPase n=1 Tax=Alkalihalobacillus sp. AL-G TaxID=2926399 RepID=UPI00272CC2DA|nr:AAA family ATPase [Alkalihalobacillus sp. AL-G]WLD93134.1 ATP-binding protein [Alkalihalobacillus sp. AL-G]
MFFLQMSGFPGSGKSTLARQISKLTDAIVIDHDVVKSALLESMEANHLDVSASGPIAYNIEWSLIDSHLAQGHSVILDSPCFYTEGVERGLHLSKKHRANYKYVECHLNDSAVIDKRLKNRKRMKSQIKQIASERLFKEWINKSIRPTNSKCLFVDTGRPLDTYINEVIQYIDE